jgi:dCTP deaminase
MSVLSKKSIVEHMNKKSIEERLIITPLVNPQESLGPASVDVRLGNEFIIMKQQSFPILDVSKKDELSKRIEKYQEKVRIDFQEGFVLHPNHLIIGSTFEYIGLPGNLMAYVIGKSSWGRMGLIIATATKVDPGFKGCITLEIINEGQVPIVLYPGILIAQLVLHETRFGKAEKENLYTGRFKCPTGPQFPDFSKDYDNWKFWYPEED